MHAGTKLLATAGAAIACAAGAPAVADAAVTGAVTGDGGTPVPLAANGAATPIRNMDVQALSHVDDAAASRSFKAVVTDPGGVGASTASPCWISKYSTDDKRYVDYHGNGTYRLTLTTYSDTNCTTAPKTYVYSWAVGAGVGLGQPGGALLTRQPNSFSTITQSIDFAGNPGAGRYEIKYALGGVLAPDGGISGPVKDAYVDSTTGKVQFNERTPGTYLMVARAVSGSYASPWSAPVTIRLIAPFDLSSRSFPDSIGPSYQVRGILGEASAGGRVTISAAKGKKGGHYRRLGRPKVNSKGVFKLRFRLRKLGWYRLRYSYKGSGTVAAGRVTERVKITRRRVR